ncbi:MAG: hypothetical protein HZC13_02745 [Nitrospirae bacterium]|nr:hypothetical protein [Nitrospirota bacterium]
MQDIIFSPWIAWNKRNSLKNSDPWGVYLLAHFDNVPEGSADPQSVETIYIGETTKGSFSKRWRGRKKLIDISKDNLHVAIFPVSNMELKKEVENAVDEFLKQRCKKSGKDTTIRKVLIKNELKERDILTQTFIKYVERKLIWEYVKLWGKRPALNKE